MNLEQFLSLIRLLAGSIGAILIRKGFTDGQTWADILGILLAVASLGWSYFHHSDAQQQARADALAVSPVAPTTVVAHDTGVPQNPTPKP